VARVRVVAVILAVALMRGERIAHSCSSSMTRSWVLDFDSWLGGDDRGTNKTKFG
jgi:hypothetical protein